MEILYEELSCLYIRSFIVSYFQPCTVRNSDTASYLALQPKVRAMHEPQLEQTRQIEHKRRRKEVLLRVGQRLIPGHRGQVDAQVDQIGPRVPESHIVHRTETEVRALYAGFQLDQGGHLRVVPRVQVEDAQVVLRGAVLRRGDL